MTTDILARIVAAGNGDVFIILSNFYCCQFSSECFYSLLKDPLTFLKKDAKKYQSPNGYPSQLKGKIMDVPGLTLGYLTSERKLVCEYPEIICLSLLHAQNLRKDEPINIKEFLNTGKLLDQKQWYMEVFLSLGAATGQLVHDKVNFLSAETQNLIVSEILHTRYFHSEIVPTNQELASPANAMPINMSKQFGYNQSSAVSDDQISDDIILPFSLCGPSESTFSPMQRINSDDEKKRSKAPPNYILLSDYCNQHSITHTTVHKWIRKGYIHSFQDSSTKWWVDKDDTPDIVRARNKITRGRKRAQVKSDGNSYEVVQKYIQDYDLFTDKVRPFIRTLEEVKYYVENGYREVEWHGNSALILDIQVDYYSKKHGATNRELIKSGHSPVVPGHEDQIFDLHHVGQRSDSPLAIIPSKLHNSKEMYSVFHCGATSSEDLHTAAFDQQRQKFWLVYLQKCEECGGFSKISYLNSKYKIRNVG